MIIGLTSNGHHAGKDTTAAMIQRWCNVEGIKYRRASLADKMKLLTAAALGFDTAGKSDREIVAMVDRFKNHGQVTVTDTALRTTQAPISGRDVLINIGGQSADHGARKLFGDEFWINQALPLDGDYEGIVTVTDVRFEPEARRIVALGGDILLIHGRGEGAGGRSEEGLPKHWVTGSIDNSGSIEELARAVDRLIPGLYAGSLQVGD